MTRRTFACLLVAFALTPISAVNAQRLSGGGGAAVLLRYRFVTGQRLTYLAMTTQRITPVASSIPGTGQFGTVESIIGDRVNGVTIYAVSVRLHENVLSVDGLGEARVALTLDHLTVSANGQPPVLRPSQSFGAFTITPNGTQRAGNDVRRHGDNAELGPILPTHPVAPGSRWVTHVWLPMPGITPIVTLAKSDNVLDGFGQVGGEPVAVISATIPLHAETNITIGSVPTHVLETGLETQRFIFGLDSGQLVSSRGQISMRISISPKDEQGQSIKEQLTAEMSQQRIG